MESILEKTITEKVPVPKLTEEDINQYSAQLVSILEQRGTMGNVTLNRQLNWPEDLYWQIRDRLIDQGKLERGRGKGGSVTLVGYTISPQSASTESLNEISVPEPSSLAERELYPPVKEGMKGFARHNRFDPYQTEITASQGKRDTGGRWSRPDLTLATYKTYHYVPGRHLEVITFEVKRIDALDVTAVFEALAHRRAAHRSFIIVCGHGTDGVYKEKLESVYEEANRQGIGLIVIPEDPQVYEYWDLQLEAEHNQPDLEKLNEFLTQQLSPGFQEWLVRSSR